MTAKEINDLLNKLAESKDNSLEKRLNLLANYVFELEKRIEKLEAKDFTRNEPLIGDY